MILKMQMINKCWILMCTKIKTVFFNYNKVNKQINQLRMCVNDKNFILLEAVKTVPKKYREKLCEKLTVAAILGTSIDDLLIKIESFNNIRKVI